MSSNWIERVRGGDRLALGRLCRALSEAHAPIQRQQLYQAAVELPWVLGLTGSPGVGKSTLVAQLITLLRQKHAKVAVLAIDPTSPFSGGAILGDRIRMQQHSEDPGVFVRSLATRGALGGLSHDTADLLHAFALWGASAIVVETVGVGQAELDVMLVADSTCVVVTPGQGDDVQAIKSGIMEVADVFVVNKADLPGASSVVGQLSGMLSLASRRTRPSVQGHGLSTHAPAPSLEVDADWQPRIVETSALVPRGVDELLAALSEHRQWLATAPGRARLNERRQRWSLRRLQAAIVRRLETDVPEALTEQARRLGEADNPDECAARVLSMWAKRAGKN